MIGLISLVKEDYYTNQRYWD